MKTLLTKIQLRLFVLILSVLLMATSCKKQDDFLNIKSQKKDVTPTTLQDYQAILDNAGIMNENSSLQGLVASDNIYLTDINLNSLDAITKNSYLWSKDVYQGANSIDWSQPYQVVENVNIVLDGLQTLSGADKSSPAFNTVKGSALFYRAFAFYKLCQLFCKPFSASAANDLGIPIRLTSDINIKSTRSTVAQSYNQILSDLNLALQLLPTNVLYKTRPSLIAANALLAKVYLSMSDYSNAYKYSDLVLKSYNTLLDYNTLKQSTSNPFPSFAKGNPEIIFYSQTYTVPATVVGSGGKARVDTNIIKAYISGDLRKSAFYLADGTTGLYRFKGSYTDNSYEFNGIACDEILLIHAECLARAANFDGALSDLNTIYKNRFTPGAYQPVTNRDQTTLIKQILLERRKEMPFTGNIRWEDLRRLNLDPNLAITLIRRNNGTVYTLAPNDKRYVFPIPDPEIQLEGLLQNDR